MHINSVYADKYSDKIDVQSFEASTQQEFNEALRRVDEQVTYVRWSRDLETLDGDDALLLVWEQEYHDTALPARQH